MKELIYLKKIILPLIEEYPSTKRQVISYFNIIEKSLTPQKASIQYGWKKVRD